MNLQKMMKLFSKTDDFKNNDKFVNEKWKGVILENKRFSAGLQ